MRKTATIYITGGKVKSVNGGMNGTAYSASVTGGVYGGACQNKGGSANIYMTGGKVEGYIYNGSSTGGIYGGSNSSGTLSGSVMMQINGGQVGTPDNHANIHGGGFGASTIVSQNVNITLGQTGAARDADGVRVYGDVYGGSALGKTNGTAETDTYKTNVTMNAGYIHGSLYGGALGNATTAANVYGPVAVEVNGGSVIGDNSAVYGCNNANGAPQRAVSVTINGTNSPTEDNPYALHAVFGGGNQAAYTFGKPVVTVNNCDNSIEYVYGGGNAATVKGTDVTIYGGDSIGHVFGGCYGANVTEYGTDVKIKGGRILEVYGGNNQSGSVTGQIKVDVAETANTSCPINVDDLYGGGNKAASSAGQISIGKCSRINRVFGGANQADVTGNISLSVTDGCVNNIFGGNNNSGTINGNIAVNVNWGANASTTEPKASVGNVYGGGNMAAYTGSPVVTLTNCTTTGSVYGGGLGSTAVATGNPQVNIGSWTEGKVIVGGSVFGGGALAAVEGDPEVVIRDCETVIKGNLYGGGDAAPVYSTNTTMWGGTVEGNVFGGGNGEDATKNPKGAQVGYKSDDTTTAGSGNSVVKLYGGKIGTWITDAEGAETCQDNTGGIFGGSNTMGNITGQIQMELDKKTCAETGAASCPIFLNEAYGAGNKAAYEGGGGLQFTIGCIDGFDCIYGGAKAANFKGDVHLKITSGTYSNVFGGNNISGTLDGKIKVTIDETGCNPVIIGNVYGGGNLAAYDGSPEVEIISCTRIGNVFGGGYGASAVVKGDTKVTVNQIPGKFLPGDPNDETNCTVEKRLGTIGNVYGGGNEAKVGGSTFVNIATGTVTGGTVSNKQKHVTGDATLQALEFTAGANITGNVYGGGNNADVAGKTNVKVGIEKN